MLLLTFNDLREMENIYQSVLEEWLVNRPTRRVAVSDFVNDVTAKIIARMPSSQTEIGKYFNATMLEGKHGIKDGFLPYCSVRYSAFHHEVEVNGVLVDQGISDLLTYLWAHKAYTLFSCQGRYHVGCDGGDCDLRVNGYITFTDSDVFDAHGHLLTDLASEAGLTRCFGKPGSHESCGEESEEWQVENDGFPQYRDQLITVRLSPGDLATLNAAAAQRLSHGTSV